MKNCVNLPSALKYIAFINQFCLRFLIAVKGLFMPFPHNNLIFNEFYHHFLNFTSLRSRHLQDLWIAVPNCGQFWSCSLFYFFVEIPDIYVKISVWNLFFWFQHGKTLLSYIHTHLVITFTDYHLLFIKYSWVRKDSFLWQTILVFIVVCYHNLIYFVFYCN